eukprot:2099402-Pleurochrysis_carterae.AAC.1
MAYRMSFASVIVLGMLVTAMPLAKLKKEWCNTTCYKRYLCHKFKWHRVASSGAPAKTMPEMRAKVEVAVDMFPTH